MDRIFDLKGPSGKWQAVKCASTLVFAFEADITVELLNTPGRGILVSQGVAYDD